MINGWVLVCADCGNTELDFNYVERNKENPHGNAGVYHAYCSKCENMGRIYGFTAGPIRLRAEKVREIKEKSEKPFKEGNR